MSVATTEQEPIGSRHVSPYTLGQKVGRVLWGVVEGTLFRWSWPTWYAYRASFLRLFGAEVSSASRIRRTVRVTCPWNLSVAADAAIGEGARLYCLGRVEIGARATVSQHAHLCAGSHDFSTPEMTLTRESIVIGEDAWVAADAFVGPGVSVGAGALLGARGCAFKDLDPWTIYGGNPAQPIKARVRIDST